MRRAFFLAAAQYFAVIRADVGEVAATVAANQLDFIDKAAAFAVQVGFNDFGACFALGGFYRLGDGDGATARQVVFVFALALGDFAGDGIHADFVFLFVVVQVDFIDGAATVQFEVQVVGGGVGVFFGDGDGLCGADFALLQRDDVLARAAVFVAFMAFVVVVGEGKAATEQGSEAEGGEEGFLGCHLANS